MESETTWPVMSTSIQEFMAVTLGFLHIIAGLLTYAMSSIAVIEIQSYKVHYTVAAVIITETA